MRALHFSEEKRGGAYWGRGKAGRDWKGRREGRESVIVPGK